MTKKIRFILVRRLFSIGSSTTTNYAKQKKKDYLPPISGLPVVRGLASFSFERDCYMFPPDRRDARNQQARASRAHGAQGPCRW